MYDSLKMLKHAVRLKKKKKRNCLSYYHTIIFIMNSVRVFFPENVDWQTIDFGSILYKLRPLKI